MSTTQTIEPVLPDESLIAEIFAAQGKSFRGGAVENLGGAPMGKGHGNDGQPFDIETACYKKPIYAEYDKARANGTRLKLVLKAGVKTMKSFALEVCAAEHVCNGSGDVALYFGTESAAESTATTRILNFYKGDDQFGGGIPRFREKMQTMRSRFDETNGALKFPDKTLFILSANLGNTQQKNLAFVGLEDSFVTEKSGMIKEMIARTTQYQKEAIIFLESQGGEKGFDFDTEFEDTDQRELHVNCPCCGKQHIFNWKAYDKEWMTRPEDFVATLTFAEVDRIKLMVDSQYPLASEAEKQSTISQELSTLQKELSEKLKGKIAGFRRGADELIKLPNGAYNEAAVLRETHFECFHCGGLWRDDGEFGPTRIALDQSAGKPENHVPLRPDALPGNVGFNIPQWINRRLPWGPMMLEKLKAERTANELGNFMPLKIWWQKVAARTWDENISAKAPEKIGATIYEIDPAKKVPGEKVRISGTDIQFNLTHMIYQAWSICERPRLLHYEWIKPATAGLSDQDAREYCKDRVRELDKLYGIEPQNSMKDCGHRPDLMREWAAEDAILVPMPDYMGRKTMKWISYGLLIGDDKAGYKWANPGRAPTIARYKQYEWTQVDAFKNGRRVKVPIHHRLWSNPSIKEIAVRWRDGDSAPKIEVHEKFLQLPPGATEAMKKESFMAQMTSERLLPWRGRPGKFRWDNEGRPNHAWDGFCMVIVRMDELGMLNHFDAPADDSE